jgi:hypothetical protein
MKVLVAGWFSFEEMGASAGDLMARDLVCEWLQRAGRSYDVALAPPFPGGVDWTQADPRDYSELVFVCGPLGNGWPVSDLLAKFSRCRRVGLNLSMLEPLDVWNPFDRLWERDSSAMSRPDISFLSTLTRSPVIGLVLIDTQPEYEERGLHERANEALRALAAEHGAVVAIDTRLDSNNTGLSAAAHVEALIARMDVILTTRLHGTVLAIKNGVPALAVDSVAGGGKIRRQAEAIGWPYVMPIEAVSDVALRQALADCMTTEARALAQECASRARLMVEQVRAEFVEDLADAG